MFVDLWKPNFKGYTLFDLYSMDKKVLKSVYEEVKKYDDGDKSNPLREIFFSLLYPSINGQSPFDHAITKNSP